MKAKILLILMAVVLVVGVVSCKKKAALGTEENPVKMYFVPSEQVDQVITSGNAIADYLTKETGYAFKTAVPTSYAAVIEAMGSSEADVAWLATFAYVLANERHEVDVSLKTVRYGDHQYRGQIVALADSDINSIEDIEGKSIAFTDAASTSGFIYPSALFEQKGIKIGESFFAGGHPQAILAVYEGKVDVGCSYWSPARPDGSVGDARRAVRETYPDIVEKVKIVGFTDWIPNDTVSFRKEFPAEMRDKIVDALLKYTETEEGKTVLDDLYSITGLVRTTDADYDVVRNALEAIGKSVEEFLGE